MEVGGDEILKLTGIKIEPETSPVQEGVKIAVDYTLSGELTNWEWVVRYTVDVAYKRNIIDIFKEKGDAEKPGSHSKAFAIPNINLEGVSKKDLMNVGLLSICVVKEGKELVAINIVSQVTKNDKGDLVKTLLSPLE